MSRVVSIQFNCPECGEPFDVPDAAAGMKGKCPCGALLDVPKESTAPPPTESGPPPPPEGEAPATPDAPSDGPEADAAPPTDEAPSKATEPDFAFDPPPADAGADDVAFDPSDPGPEPPPPPTAPPQPPRPPRPKKAPPAAPTSPTAPTALELAAARAQQAEPAPAVEPPPLPVNAPQRPPAAVSGESKYPRLRRICGLLRVLAVVVFVLSTLNAALFVWSAAPAFEAGNALGIVVAIVTALAIVATGALVSLILRALSELLQVVMDIEENTRSR